MDGFFPASTSKQSVSLSIPHCGACGLFQSCDSPKMTVTGKGLKGILLLGECPGFDEDQQNQQFVGKAGQTLRSIARKFGIDIDRDCWKTNALICRPKDDDGKNRTPTSDEISYCRPNLNNTIAELNPRIIIPMGAVAVKSLLGPLWKEDTGTISKWVGWKVPLQKLNTWICPTYHPSFLNHSEDKGEGPAIKLAFEKHLKSAFQLEDRPWDTVPDYKKQIQIVMSSTVAEDMIWKLISSRKAFAWDLESNFLKPDKEEAEIISCAISIGEYTFSFPWIGVAIEAMGKLLESSNPKIGWNMKHEHRWIKSKLGIEVINWKHDGMLSTHHLDNRAGICSLGFQSFVRLGMEPYDTHIKPYLQSVDDSGRNRIRELSMDDVLKYNGLDALLTYKLAKIQREEMKNEK